MARAHRIAVALLPAVLPAATVASPMPSLACPPGTSQKRAFYTDEFWCARPDGTRHGPYRNGWASPTEEGGYHLTDGRVTLSILPWKISSFNGAGIEQPGMDHIGFRVPALAAFKAQVDKIAKTNIHLAPKPIDFDSEGAARLALLRKCAHGSVQLADPDGTLIDVAEAH